VGVVVVVRKREEQEVVPVVLDELAADTARPDDGTIVQPPEAEDGEVVVELERDERGRPWRSYRPAFDEAGHPIWLVCEIQRDAAGKVVGSVETRELRIEEKS